MRLETTTPFLDPYLCGSISKPGNASFGLHLSEASRYSLNAVGRPTGRRPLLSVRVFAASLFLLGFDSSSFCAADINWGPTVAGLRLGVSLIQGAEPELHIVYANLSATEQTLLVAVAGGFTVYEFEIWAQMGPGKEEHQIFSWGPNDFGRVIPISLQAPQIATIPPGRMYEIRIPLKQLFESHRGGDVPLENLLRQGYRVRVLYRIGPAKRYPNLWTGEIESGYVGLPTNIH
jgi:hypothetical protein